MSYNLLICQYFGVSEIEKNERVMVSSAAVFCDEFSVPCFEPLAAKYGISAETGHTDFFCFAQH